jgi:hypothetical protein
MKPFQFYFPKYPAWAEAEPLLKKIFFPWLNPLLTPPRKDSPHKAVSIKRHSKARALRRHMRPRRKIGAMRMHSRDRQSLSWNVERQLNLEIEKALHQHNIEEALYHIRRYVSLPFERASNRLWRKAFVHEYDGEVDEAIKLYKELIHITDREKPGAGVSLLTYHLVRLAPDVAEHRHIRAKYYLKEDCLRCAVNELQVLKRLQRDNGDATVADRTLNAVKALVLELKRRGRLERQGPPEGEFSFDFGEDDQVDLDLEDVEV